MSVSKHSLDAEWSDYLGDQLKVCEELRLCFVYVSQLQLLSEHSGM